MNATVKWDPDSAEVLELCKKLVPANLPLHTAIEAHRIALDQNSEQADETQTVMRYALQAVIFAKTSTVEDSRALLDYLTSLPIEAWFWENFSAEEFRTETLRAITRGMTSRTMC